MTREIIIKYFDTASDYLEWATFGECLWKSATLASRKTDREYNKWSGTASYEEAYNLARYGWTEGLELIDEKVKLADAIIPADKTELHRYDVGGFYPDPARAAAGEPCSMIDPFSEETKQKQIVKIRTNFCFNAGEEEQTIMNWGGAICSYVTMLEKTGYGVQLDNVSESRSCHYGGPDLSFQFPLKAAGAPLSLASVVFWWAHPSALRRIEFSADEKLDIEYYYRDTYGSQRNVTQAEPGTLSLSIKDACATMHDNLNMLRKKHMKLLDDGDPLRHTLQELAFKR